MSPRFRHWVLLAFALAVVLVSTGAAIVTRAASPRQASDDTGDDDAEGGANAGGDNTMW